MRKLLLVFLFLSVSVAARSDDSCRLGDQRPSLSEFRTMIADKELFANYVQENFTNHENYLEEFLCCLPEELQREARYDEETQTSQPGYELMTYSRALQTGHVKSPRLLFWLDNTVFSVNGNDPTQSGHAKIEMAQWKDAGDGLRAEYMAGGFHAEVEGFHWSEPNGNKSGCIGCHTTKGYVPAEGVRAIGQPFGYWSRVADGTSSYDCANYRPYFQEIRQKASEWFHGNDVSSNRNFRCLEAPPAEQDLGRYWHLVRVRDPEIAALDAPRILRAMKSSANFERFKYAIAGQNRCRELDITVEDASLSLSDWLPSSVLQNIQNREYIGAEMTLMSEESSDMELWLDRYQQMMTHQMDENSLIRQTQQSEYESLQANAGRFRRHLIEANNAAIGICEESDLSEARQLVATVLQRSRSAGNPQLFDLFIVDTLLKSQGSIVRHQGGSGDSATGEMMFNKMTMTSPLLRYLLEGRGVSMRGWDMTADGVSYSRRLNSVIDLLVEQDSELREIFSMEDDESACRALRERSLQALSSS